MDAVLWMSRDTRQQIAQVNEGVQAMTPGALDQAEEHRRGASAAPAAQVQPIAAILAIGPL